MSFYSNFISLCNSREKTPSRVVLEVGLKKSAVTRWKAGGSPTDATAQKIADYFGVSVQELMGEEKAPTPGGERTTSEEDLKLQVAAYWGGGEDLSKEELDGLWSDAEGFYKFKLEQLKKSRSKQ